jgi:hypothetical protein
MPRTIPISQLVLTCVGPELYRVTVFDGKECIEAFDTRTPVFAVLQAMTGDLMVTHDVLSSYHLLPLPKESK